MQDVLTVIDDARQLRVPESPLDFLRGLERPVWMKLVGKDSTRTRAVSTLIHGNEPSGFRALHAYLRSGRTPAVTTYCFIGNIAAAKLEPVFSHRMLPSGRDLNRCFHAPYTEKEGAIAQALLEQLEQVRPEALIDLHNNSGNNPAYGLGPVVEPRTLGLTSFFTHRFVLTHLRLGTLGEACAPHFPTVTLECGRMGDPQADHVAEQGLRAYLEAEQLPQVGSDAFRILHHPVRLHLRPESRVSFHHTLKPGDDLTLSADLDRHNFERMPPGTVVGWMAPGAAWPFRACDENGKEISHHILECRDGVVVLRTELIPVMMTIDPFAALTDCLCYFVRG